MDSDTDVESEKSEGDDVSPDAAAYVESKISAGHDDMKKFTLLKEDFPHALQFTRSINEAMQQSGMTAEMFCDFALQGDAQEPTQKPRREITLQMVEGKIIATGEARPMFGDIIYEASNSEIPFGVIQKVRQIAGHVSVFEIEVANQHSDFVSFVEETDPSAMVVTLQDFDLGLAPQCKNAVQTNIVASFVSHIQKTEEPQSSKDIYSEWVHNGLENRDSYSYDEIVAGLKASFAKAISKVQCPPTGELIDGRCQEILEKAVFEIGRISDFQAYLKNLIEFQHDFAAVANNGQEKSWVQEFSAFFIVDESSFKRLQERENMRRLQLSTNADQCTAQFLLDVHRDVFDCYLIQLNDCWQQPNINFSQIAAIMWLLFYTQLPVFVQNLLQLLMPSQQTNRSNIIRSVPQVLQRFQSDLITHLSNFLPIRSRENITQQKLVDSVRMYLEKIGHGVLQQMTGNLKRQTSDCMMT